MANHKRRSCDVCYKRKIRCDAAETGGTCDWCLHHNLTCTFTPRKARSRNAKGKAVSERASSTVSPQESSLQSPPNTNPSAASTPYSTTAGTGSLDHGRTTIRSNRCSVCQSRTSRVGSRHAGRVGTRRQEVYPGHHFGFVCLLTGIPHISDSCADWVRMRSGLTPQFDFPSLQRCKLDSVSPLSASKTTLPPRWAFDRLRDAFIKSDLKLVFPLIDEVLFEEVVQLAYTGETSTMQHISALACVLSFITMVALNFQEIEEVKYVDTEVCAKAAQILIGECLEDTSLTTLQTYLLIIMFEMATGRIQAASMYNTLACRVVFVLRGHQRLFPSPHRVQYTIEDREDRHIRLLFWMCYYFDKSFSLRTGHPPAIDDEFCDLTLPEGYLEYRWSPRVCDPTTDLQDVFFPGDMELTLVKSKVIRSLYGNRSWEKSDAELLRSVRELDSELENWRSAVPRQYAPALSVRKDVTLSSDLSKCMHMVHIELHLEYHHILNVIHSASGLSSVAGLLSGDVIPGIQSSLDLSVEVSRSTLIYLTASADRIVSEAFWAFVFYPMSALMTLFLSIVRNPEGENVVKDLEIIAMSSTTVRNMPIHNAVPFAKEYLRQVDLFVKELHRLGRGAIVRANREVSMAGMQLS